MQRTSHEIRSTDGLQLLAFECGNREGPAVVFLPGWTQCHLAFERLQDGRLARDFRLIMFDIRGHGASAKPLEEERYPDSSQWAADIDSLADALAIEAFSVVACSAGAFSACDYLRYGRRPLGGLVLVAAATEMNTESAAERIAGPMMVAHLEDMLSDDFDSCLSATLSWVQSFTDPADPTQTARTLGWTMTVPPPVRRALVARVEANDDVLADVSCPTLVLHGTADTTVPLESSDRILRLIPHAESVRMTDVGHAPFHQASEAFDREVAEFLSKAGE